MLVLHSGQTALAFLGWFPKPRWSALLGLLFLVGRPGCPVMSGRASRHPALGVRYFGG